MKRLIVLACAVGLPIGLSGLAPADENDAARRMQVKPAEIDDPDNRTALPSKAIDDPDNKSRAAKLPRWQGPPPCDPAKFTCPKIGN